MPQAPPDPRRAHPRIPMSVPAFVTVTQAGGKASRAEKIANMSLGGVFLEMNDPPPFGAELTLEFRLGMDGTLLRCKGFVAWAQKGGTGEMGERVGAGVRLTGLSVAQMKVLSDFIESRLHR